jgi:hypothetical protein
VGVARASIQTRDKAEARIPELQVRKQKQDFGLASMCTRVLYIVILLQLYDIVVQVQVLDFIIILHEPRSGNMFQCASAGVNGVYAAS